MQVQPESNSWHASEPPAHAPAHARHSTSHCDNHDSHDSHDSHDNVLTSNNRTEQLFNELQRVIELSGGASSPLQYGHERERKLPDFEYNTRFSFSKKMPPKKSGRAILKEEGMKFPCGRL
jgi:hypothetical protein